MDARFRFDWRAVGLFALGYAASLAVGHVFPWLPGGLLLGVLLSREPRGWPGFAAVAFLVCSVFGVALGRSLPGASLVGAATCAQALLGAWLIRRLVTATPDLSSVAQVVGILLVSAANAALWTSAVWLWADATVAPTTGVEWFRWWSGDLIGTAVIVPLVLSFSRIGPAPAVPVFAVAKSEAVALALLVVAGGTFVFNDAWHPHVPLSHGLVPLLTWAAIRFGVRGVSMASLSFAVLGSLFTVLGAGAAIEAELSVMVQVNRLHLFLAVASGTGLLLAASVHERAQALARHRDEHLRLDAVFSGARDALVVADAATGTIIDANPAAAALFGRPSSELIGLHHTVLHPPGTADENRRRFHERAAEASPGLRTTEALGADGTRVEVEISSRTVTLADGRRGVVGAFRDVSERRRSEDRYRSILQSSMDGFWLVDTQGRIQDVNDTACEMTGYTREELLTMSVSDVNAGELPEESLRHLGMIAEAGRHRFESRQRRKDGQLRDVEVSTLLVPDHSERIVAFVRDITDEKRSAAIMRARVRLLEYASTHSLEELLVAAVDEAEALTGSGIGFLHSLGADQRSVTVQAWSTRTRREACRTDQPARHADIAEAGVWVDCVRQRRAVIHNDYAALAHRTGMPEGHAPLIRELVVPVFRGEFIVAMLGVGNRPDAYTDLDVETVTRLADLAWDIAERTRTQESLRASEERFRLLVETSNEGVWVMDGEHITTYVNQAMADMLGYVPGEMVGHPVEEFLFPGDLAFHGQRMAVRHAGESEVYERRFRRRDGRALWTLASAKALSADDGRFLGSFALFSDITERKDAERALERSRAEIKALARQLVEAQEIASRELARELHDRVGQNLTALNLNFTRLQEGLSPQRDARLIAPLQDSLRLVSETMGHVRDVMAELRPPVLEDCGVFAALRWLGGQFARRTGLVVTVKAEDSARPSTEVETALFRIAQEALTNVARHASATTVAVDLIGQDGRLYLRVKDDGVGFETGGPAKPGCWGLLTMMERAETVEGRLAVVSAPGAGTSVEVDVPA